MIFEVQTGNTITEYYLIDIDRDKLSRLKDEIKSKYGRVVHCEYIDHTLPYESEKVQNVKVEEYSNAGDVPLFRIEADFVTYPPVIDAINGALIGSGKGLSDLMSLNAKDYPLGDHDILEELRGISRDYKESGSNEAVISKVVALSEKVIATDLETEQLYAELKSCVVAREHTVRTVQSHRI